MSAAEKDEARYVENNITTPSIRRRAARRKAAGAEARVEGQVAVKTLTPSEVAHYESEGASFAKKDADGSAREVRIVATGVEMKRANRAAN